MITGAGAVSVAEAGLQASAKAEVSGRAVVKTTQNGWGSAETLTTAWNTFDYAFGWGGNAGGNPGYPNYAFMTRAYISGVTLKQVS
jgi:hypothetical protein